MTRTFRAAMLASGLVGAMGVGTVSAQISDPVEFTTTFPFTVGNTTVPAGRYEIRRAAENSNEVLELAGTRNHVAVFFETVGVTPPDSPARASEVVFKKYGDQYVLKDIWEAGDSTGAATLVTRAESREARMNGAPMEQHIAAVNAKAAHKAASNKAS